ncbi:MAG: bifunctional folylpolyglutamate synthase/dihydrofolate synthase [Actinobacteria bacterium]|nr:bifunctional folylpolyglutamate synthase/dihydrofolate synthase [Actinomycetota bacterium]
MDGRSGEAGWEAYLGSLAAFGMRPGLERVSALLDRLGRPQLAYRVIHVVGTNGKSSTTRYCEALLRAHGVRSGAYLSPHISGWAERVVVDGGPVADAVFGAAVERVRKEVAGLPRDLGETTQFEVLTVAALLAFAESRVEAVALEAGLGGRLDATNVVAPPVVVLTNIALEHTEVLGDTRELIFGEKAAVIKGGDAVFGELDGLEDEARRVCAVAGARPHFLRPDLRPGDLAVEGTPDDFTVSFAPDGAGERWAGLSVPTPALYQVRNAALAVAAVRLLLGGLDEAAVRQALAGTAVPGRLHLVSERPLVLADGAHNPDGVRVLAQSLAAVQVPRPTVGVLAMMQDKDYAAMLDGLLPLLDDLVCTQASEPRSLSAAALADAAAAAARRRGQKAVAVSSIPDPHAALARARELAGEEGSVLIAGSLYLLEDLRDVLAGAAG